MKHICSALNRNGEKGFTLVELIVVIAILAILAAVAYPVYTGYIEKANEAADQVLIGAVNEAFRSALYDVGYNNGLPDDANATLKSKKVSEVTSTDIDGLNDTFFKYFKGNENTAFKVVDALLYSPAQGFYASLNGGNKILLSNGSLVNKGTDADGITTWEWQSGGEKYTIKTNEAGIQSFNNSSFGKNMTMGQLMGEIENVANAAAAVVKKNPENVPSILTKEMKGYLESLGLDPVEDRDEYLQAVANALVIQAAKQSEIYSVDDVMAWMKGELKTLPWPDIDYKNDGFMSGNAADGALKYGILTGFLNSEEGRSANIKFVHDPHGAKEQIDMTLGEYYDQILVPTLNSADANKAITQINEVMEALKDSSGYQEYLNNGEAQQDIEGYLSALEMVRENSDEFMRSGVVSDGYGDGNPDLTEMLSALFGG